LAAGCKKPPLKPSMTGQTNRKIVTRARAYPVSDAQQCYPAAVGSGLGEAKAYPASDAYQCYPTATTSAQGEARAFPISDEHHRRRKTPRPTRQTNRARTRFASWNIGTMTGKVGSLPIHSKEEE